MPSIDYQLRDNDIWAALATPMFKAMCPKLETIVFTATTGRTGTHSLATLFPKIDHTGADHEPRPSLAGEPLRRVNEGEHDYFRAHFRRFKLPKIYYQARFKRRYIEANHVFIKAFADLAAAEFGSRMKVIYLVRNYEDVAQSFFHRHRVADPENGGAADYTWLLRPDYPENRLKAPADLASYDAAAQTYLSYIWYCYEIEARTVEFRKRFPNVAVIPFLTDDLNDAEKLSGLFEALEIPAPANLESLVGIRASSSERKRQAPEGVTDAMLSSLHQHCVHELDAMGLSWPEVRPA